MLHKIDVYKKLWRDYKCGFDGNVDAREKITIERCGCIID
jgi:hypothetical protein